MALKQSSKRTIPLKNCLNYINLFCSFDFCSYKIGKTLGEKSMSTKITVQEALEKFGQGFDCSQVVLENVAENLDLDKKTALKITSAFGGGMCKGDTCGCVTGALMAIGLKYGHFEPGDEISKNEMLAKKAEFEKEFSERNGSCICREILKYDLSKPEEMEKILEEGLLTTLCPKLVVSACDILEEIME